MNDDEPNGNPDGPTAPADSLEQMLFAVAESFAEEGGADAAPTPEAFVARYEEVAHKSLPEITRVTVDAMLQGAPEHLAANRAQRADFQASLRTMWGEALDSLESLIEAFYHLGRGVLTEAGRAGHFASDARWAALGRLHARACRTAREVLALLEQGLADGALGRCRTLHEVAVVARVLSTHDQELSKRYTLHALMRAARAMQEFMPHHEALGWEPVSEGDLQAAAAQVDALVTEYGPRFTHDYGWADGVVPPAIPKHRVAVQDLERAAGLARFRPFSDWASASIHAGPQGLDSLGIPLAAQHEVLYSAGSTSGLADPGQHAALSIGHFSGALVLHVSSLGLSVQVGAIAKLVTRCQAQFFAAHTAVEERTREVVTAEADEGQGLGTPEPDL